MHVMSSVLRAQTRHTKNAGRTTSPCSWASPRSPATAVLDPGRAQPRNGRNYPVDLSAVRSSQRLVGGWHPRSGAGCIRESCSRELADAAELPCPETRRSTRSSGPSDRAPHWDETISAITSECERGARGPRTLSISHDTPNQKHAIERLQDKGCLDRANPAISVSRTEPLVRRGLEAAGFEIDVAVKRRQLQPFNSRLSHGVASSYGGPGASSSLPTDLPARTQAAI